MGTVFDSLPEAYEFYNLYSWESGFGIRYGKSRQNVRGSKCMQEIVCGSAGKPVRDNSTSTRTNCPTLIRLLRTEDHGWFISEQRMSHNHPMLRTCAEKLHCPSHKHIDKYTRDLVKHLRENNVNLSKVYSIIGSLFGRMENVPFTKRCLRNFCGKLSREQADQKTPISHQARAMEVAIQQVLPGTTHRWCKWHVLRKAKESLGAHYTKRGDFQPEFHKVLNGMLTVDEFETAWMILLEKYKLQNNAFMSQIYEVRHKWAKPYFSEKFCAKMTSTQRSESANHLLKENVLTTVMVFRGEV
ncbi:hypothetical protein ACQ4PT_044595 [Festuca glaucescens]